MEKCITTKDELSNVTTGQRFCLSPELKEELTSKGEVILKNEEKRQEYATKLGITTKEIIDIINDLSKPSSSGTDNHETGFWKGAAMVALAVLGGIGVLTGLAITHQKDK